MLTEFTTPGPALTVDDDATIYSLLTTRLETSAENAPLSPCAKISRPSAKK